MSTKCKYIRKKRLVKIVTESLLEQMEKFEFEYELYVR